MNFRIIRNRASNGAKNLAVALNCKRNKLGVWPPKIFNSDHIIINWGCSKPLPASITANGRTLLNEPEAVGRAANKLNTFNTLKLHNDIKIPKFYTQRDFNVVETQLNGSNRIIFVARSLLSGHSGQGITILRNGDAIPSDTKIVVEYIKKKAEYRAHVAMGRMILLAQKRKRSNTDQTQNQQLIRSCDNGWVHAVNNVDPPPEGLELMCIKAVQYLGLDFGAVDVVVTEDGKVYILEVNTAPGIEGETTIRAYKEAFESLEFA
jgi:glutathione synthase/RimK-type ligase-like ATP-grasp enzyme